MKKLTRKLFLSIAALACCAATLVSTTFAWYVNNPSADINAVTGSTASAGADGSLSVSTTGAKNTWYKTTDAATSATALEPVTTADCLAFTDAAGATSTKYQDYTFWIKAAGDAETTATQDVNIQLVTTNESVLAGQIAYSTAGLDSGVQQGNLFAVDAVYALRMGISIQAGTTGEDGNATTDAALAFQGTNKMIDVKTASTDYASEVTTAAGVTNISAKAVDANEYYEALNGSAHANGTEVEGAAALPTLTLNTNVPYKVTIRVWLEGTDKYCFNSCGSQNFTFKFDFNLAQ